MDFSLNPLTVHSGKEYYKISKIGEARGMRIRLSWLFFLLAFIAAAAGKVWQQRFSNDGVGSFNGEGWMLWAGYGVIGILFLAAVLLLFLSKSRREDDNREKIAGNPLGGMIFVYLAIAFAYYGYMQLSKGVLDTGVEFWPAIQGASLLAAVVPSLLLAAEMFGKNNYLQRHKLAGILFFLPFAVYFARLIASFSLPVMTEFQWLELARSGWSLAGVALYFFCHLWKNVWIKKLACMSFMCAALAAVLTVIPYYVGNFSGMLINTVFLGREYFQLPAVLGAFFLTEVFAFSIYFQKSAEEKKKEKVQAARTAEEAEEPQGEPSYLQGTKKAYYFDKLVDISRTPEKSTTEASVPEGTGELPSLVEGGLSQELLEQSHNEWFSMTEDAEEEPEMIVPEEIPLEGEDVLFETAKEPVLIEEQEEKAAILGKNPDGLKEIPEEKTQDEERGAENSLSARTRLLRSISKIYTAPAVQEQTEEFPSQGVISGELWQSYPREREKDGQEISRDK